MKWKLRKFTKTFGITKTNLTINSDCPENSAYYDNTNKKVIGKFKDEAASTPIVELVDLKSKMYSYIKNDEKGGKTAKGIKKNVIKNYIKHKDKKRITK